MATTEKYETFVDIPNFAGVNYAGDGYNMSMRYAVDAENVNCTAGRFSPMREGRQLEQELVNPIGTLAILSRRYGDFTDANRNVMVAVSNGKIYTKILDGDDDWTLRYQGLTNNNCDFVTYEVNEDEDTIDVLLLSNADDGMYCLYGDELDVEYVPTPYRFGVIERYNERIWGTAITDHPDTLCYSVPFDPFDWSQNVEIPEDGGGEINQPSWDGDSFKALRQYGSQLLAFKQNSIWRILGTDPGEFVIREQYGHGTVEENTICVYNDLVYMLGFGGIMAYDGTLVQPFRPEETSALLRNRLNASAYGTAVGVVRDRTYCLAIAIDGSDINNAVLEYNMAENTFSLRTGLYVKTFAKVDDRVFYTSSTYPGKVFEMSDDGHALPVKWESGYQDLGLKSSAKSGFIVYFMAEAETPFDLVLGIRTEKKLKQRRLQVTPGKPYRVQLNAKGRYFRLELSSTTIIPYTILGGVRIYVELDPD